MVVRGLVRVNRVERGAEYVAAGACYSSSPPDRKAAR